MGYITKKEIEEVKIYLYNIQDKASSLELMNNNLVNHFIKLGYTLKDINHIQYQHFLVVGSEAGFSIITSIDTESK